MRRRSKTAWPSLAKGVVRVAAERGAYGAVVALWLALSLGTACTDASHRSPDSASSASSATPFRVALLTPGPITDQAWNGGAYTGLTAIRDSMGAQISHIQTQTPAEFDENFRQYGAQGYRLVFGHGFEFQDAAARIAPSYPKTVYVVTSGRVVGANLAGVDFAFEESSYEAGMLAGTLTRSNIIGMIAGAELPPVKASFAAFAMGVHSVNPAVKMLTGYIGNWNDVSAGKELALTQIGRGADLVFQNADAAGLGVFQAAKEKNILAIGANYNQSRLAPNNIAGSVVIDFPKTFLRIAREVQGGTFVGRVIRYGMRDDIVRLEINPLFNARVSAQTRAAIDSVDRAFRAGTFHALDDIVAASDTSRHIKP